MVQRIISTLGVRSDKNGQLKPEKNALISLLVFSQPHAPLSLLCMNSLNFCFAMLLASSGLVVSAADANDMIRSFEVRTGYLEYNDTDPKKRYTFHWDNQEEAFDDSSFAILSSSGSRFPGLPNLKEFGVKTASGLVCEFGNGSPNEAMRKFMEQHPKEVGAALIFIGATGEKLEIKLEGPTPVYRIDLDLHGLPTTLWKNIPEKTVEKPKSDKTDPPKKTGSKG